MSLYGAVPTQTFVPQMLRSIMFQALAFADGDTDARNLIRRIAAADSWEAIRTFIGGLDSTELESGAKVWRALLLGSSTAEPIRPRDGGYTQRSGQATVQFTRDFVDTCLVGRYGQDGSAWWNTTTTRGNGNG